MDSEVDELKGLSTPGFASHLEPSILLPAKSSVTKYLKDDLQHILTIVLEAKTLVLMILSKEL